jgi:hypothetical protein
MPGVPVSISNNSAPNAKISVRASASKPSICSGAMYWNGAEDRALRGEVRRRRRQHRETAGRDDRRGALRETEVEQFRPGLGEHHVRGLEIAMDDARAVRLVERVADLMAIVSAWAGGIGPHVSRWASVSPSSSSRTR